MSPKCLPVEARREVIRDHILHSNYEELAIKCGCAKRTIIRTINDWREEGGFNELLFDEFVDVYPIVKNENPDKALDKIVYLLGKGITRKAEIKSEHHEEIKHVEELNVTMRNYEDEVQRVVRRYIREDSPQ